jgi:hypothetical protein
MALVLGAPGAAHAASVDLSASNLHVTLSDLRANDGITPEFSHSIDFAGWVTAIAPSASSFLEGLMPAYAELTLTFDVSYAVTIRELEGEFAQLEWSAGGVVVPYAPVSTGLHPIQLQASSNTGALRSVSGMQTISIKLRNDTDTEQTLSLYQASTGIEMSVPSAVPEPSTYALMFFGLAAMLATRSTRLRAGWRAGRCRRSRARQPQEFRRPCTARCS